MDESGKEPFFLSDSQTSSDDNDNKTPFDRFLKQPGINMLEAALPYVSVSMRKPLALFMKFLEVHRIMSDLDRDDVLMACGFEPNTPNPEAMLRAMKMAGGRNANPQIDRILNMMNTVHSYQSFLDLMQNNPEMASFLTNFMRQAQRGNQNPSSFSGQSASDFAGASPDLMNLVQQVSGKNGMDLSSLLSQLSGKEGNDLSALLSQLSEKNGMNLSALLSQLTGNRT